MLPRLLLTAASNQYNVSGADAAHVRMRERAALAKLPLDLLHMRGRGA